MFPHVSPKQSFPELESEILAFWKANNIFQKSIDSRSPDNPYRFYDGPPFITGMPHYGSLLSSVVKDVVGRYWTMRGKRVERVWGWDCHGLPIEEKVQKKLGLSSNKEIEERGVKEFIDGCYEYTELTSAEWGWYIDKIGRWVDMDRAYRTMDQDYMESVLWVFKQLWDKSLIYQGKRVSLYSWKLGTPISNFEVAMDDTYQEVNDPAITVKFHSEFTYGSFAFITNHKGKLLLGKHKKTGKWKIPGGKFEPGETKEQCLEREILEETGIKIINCKHINTSVEFYQGVAYYGYAFVGSTHAESVVNGEPDKFEEWKFFSLDAVRAMKDSIAKYDHEALEVFLGERKAIIEFKDFSILAWTTTPWTIPANMALAVGANIEYVIIENNDEQFVVAKNRAEVVFKGKGEYKVLRELKGSDMVGVKYTPPFPEYYSGIGNDKVHRVYATDFATDTDGTGIVHIAPEFGDVDFSLAQEVGIPVTEAMDEAGKYTSEIFDYEGTHYLDANLINIERMKANNTLFKNESITHRIPFCPRSNTPLVQKAQSSWFIDIQSQKEKLLEANTQIHWFPEYLKFGRFAKGIESAPDWCISRTRYWGAPMPVWMNEKGEKLVVGSREEVFERNKPFGQLTKVIFVRHREGGHNLKNINDCKNEYTLTEKGKQDAIILAHNLENIQIDAVYSSPFTRCQQTITPLAESKRVNIILDERIREIDSGNWNGMKTPAGGDAFDNKQLGEIGESHLGCYQRVSEFLQEIVKRHAGETVVICSHGDPLIHMKQFLTGFDYNNESLRRKLYPKKEGFEVEYIFSDSYTLLNLHKPYIDNILLTPESMNKPKKVLGIHGWTDDGFDDADSLWSRLKTQLDKKTISLEVPHFHKEKETSYVLWKKTFEGLHFEDYDTVVAHSLGCPLLLQYILESRVHIKKLILIAPSGLTGNSFLEKILPEIDLTFSNVGDYIENILIVHSKNDSSRSAPHNFGKNLSLSIGARFVSVDGYDHHFKHGGENLLAGIIASDSVCTRIPEVLDVWMDSGSMPYAQMHYPFENTDAMEKSFPADFIAEYVGQLRAWFYVMHVLGVLLNPHNTQTPLPSFTNVITTGVINGNDGRKMSKSFGNFPDPRDTLLKYGADPIRFYMLNSPLLSGGDMDFKEEGIVETIKSVMLPLWNTYSFFTTYANIDSWTPNPTEVWYSRHAESESNAISKMSDESDNPELTEKGKTQATQAGVDLKLKGVQFDFIVHTDTHRAHDTAHLIGDALGFTGEYKVDARFSEQKAGEYANKTLKEIALDHEVDPQDFESLRRIYKNNSSENIEQLETRILSGYKSILEDYEGKKILIVGHAGSPRPILYQYFGMEKDDVYYRLSIPNATPFPLMTTELVNPLDRWILSQLQVLIGTVHDAMESYDVSRACRSLVDFVDSLTNWYIRLSRRRFWSSEMTPDKESGYSTLYTVLVEYSKLLAPFMPFISESIYRGLTQSDNEKSVHLAYCSFPQKFLIDEKLNQDMKKCEIIVSLGLTLRSRKNIRVRQPLASVTITEKLSSYYETLIREELNVKKVLFEDPLKIARKICKPDARKIGPKYSKDVQTIIQEAKNGNFTEKENGDIEVLGFILNASEYTLEYIPLDGVGDVEGGEGMVIAMNMEITQDLKLEGLARDIIRTIQEMRKEANYHVTDRIDCSMEGESVKEILDSYGTMILSETLANTVSHIATPDISRELQLEEGGEVLKICLAQHH